MVAVRRGLPKRNQIHVQLGTSLTTRGRKGQPQPPPPIRPVIDLVEAVLPVVDFALEVADNVLSRLTTD
jgi:hypothetical protein